MEDDRTVTIFYHNDMDGLCAAAVVHDYFCNNYFDLLHNYSFDSIPVNYDKPLDLSVYHDSDPKFLTTFVLDFSPPVEDMEKLIAIHGGLEFIQENKNLIWIDHHKTTIEKFAGHQAEQLPGVRVVGKCGALLTYEDLFKTKAIPRLLRLVNDWDVWEHKFGNDTKWFKSGFEFYAQKHKWDTSFGIRELGLMATSTDCRFEDEKLHAEIDGIIRKGKEICEIEESVNIKLVDTVGYATKFEDYHCFVLNKAFTNSTTFDSADSYDFYVSFYFSGNAWVVSLYSETIDVSEIAKQHGGGGHAGAAGFTCSKLPDWIVV